MRIAILYSRLSGYTASCLKALAGMPGVELLVIRVPPVGDAPFDASHFSWIDHLYERPDLSTEQMIDLLEEFPPQGLYMTGWFDKGYLRVARHFRKQGIPVVAGSDTQWTGSLRQQLARIAAPLYLHSAIDVLWVAGERQYDFARRLGFTGSKCLMGCYSCDWDAFASVYDPSERARKRSFLFVGRYVEVKGLDVLVDAYRRYRSSVDDPWPLVCAGRGEQQSLLAGVEGIEDVGFVQPDKLPGLMARHGAMILPSRREPWGVVVNEAATTGLPLICSDAVGAAVHLLLDGYNGFLFENGSAGHLAACMEQMSKRSPDDLGEMGRRSHELSKQYTPERWAKQLLRGLEAGTRQQ